MPIWLQHCIQSTTLSKQIQEMKLHATVQSVDKSALSIRGVVVPPYAAPTAARALSTLKCLNTLWLRSTHSRATVAHLAALVPRSCHATSPSVPKERYG